MRAVANRMVADSGTVNLYSLARQFPILNAPVVEAAVMVSDTGIGMSPEEVALAVQPFGQVENAMIKKYEGTGLGLPLARRLTELQAGNL